MATECVFPWPNYTMSAWPTAPVQQGCICPPTSEQTCENPECPRKDWSKRTEQKPIA
jgi:hypothetical protein